MLLGNGDGAFGPPQLVGGRVVGDFNGDGIPDLLSGPAVLLGNGDGSFRQSANLAFKSSAGVAINASYSYAVVGDFNGDGIDDVIITGMTIVQPSPIPFPSEGVSTIDSGNGDGTFRSVSGAEGAVNGPMVVGDFNGDGKLDLASSSGYVFVDYGNGDGTFRSGQIFSANYEFYPAVADLNGDGRTDLIFVTAKTPGVGVVLGQELPAAGITLASSPNPSSYGQPVTLTATVTPSSATGTVQFYDGTTFLAYSTLTNGLAAVTTNILSVGTHSLQAVYGGDTFNFGSSSPVLIQTVNPVTPSISFTSSANPSSFGETIRIVVAR